nr:reverse transcriptase domain-containing protein [Tanacetum cinerariifolium]
WDEVIEQVQRKEKEENVVMRYQPLKRKPQIEAQAKKNMMTYLKNMTGFKMNYLKGMSYDDIQKAAKKQKLDKEVEELKRHLQIVPNDEDVVYTEATSLARKHAVATTSVQYCLEKIDHESIVLAASVRVLFFLSATPFCSGNRNGGNNVCSYKTFTACNPKEFDRKGGAVALTHWIEKKESMFDNSGCTANQRVRYAASCFVKKALTWWNKQVQARGRKAAIGMSWNDFKALLVEEFCPSKKI